MRRAREQLIALQRQQRHDRVQARLDEEAAVNKAAKDADASDREVAAFIRDLNGMTSGQIKRGARRMKKKARSGLSWGQRRAITKALKRKK